MMDELLNFFSVINSIKHKERKGWIDIGVKGVKDTIASHSFGASLLGWSLAKEHGLDEVKVVKLLLVHDLIMSEVSDITPEDSSYSEKHEMEKKAFSKVLEKIPSSMKGEYDLLFNEYHTGKSEEWKLAKDCDKLDTVLQCYQYDKEKCQEFIEGYRNRLRSEVGKNIIEKMRKKLRCF